jgi:predicted RNase H-like nuclease (RuvC/YqgF family)
MSSNDKLANEALKTVQDVMDDFCAQIESLKKEKSELSSSNKVLNQALLETKESMNQKLFQSNYEIADLQKQLQNAQADVERIRAENAISPAYVEQLKAQNAELTAKIARFQRCMNMDEMDRLVQDNQTLESVKAEVQAFKQLGDKTWGWKTQCELLQPFQREFDRREEAVKQLKSNSMGWETKCTAVKQELQELKLKVERFENGSPVLGQSPSKKTKVDHEDTILTQGLVDMIQRLPDPAADGAGGPAVSAVPSSTNSQSYSLLWGKRRSQPFRTDGQAVRPASPATDGQAVPAVPSFADGAGGQAVPAVPSFADGAGGQAVPAVPESISLYNNETQDVHYERLEDSLAWYDLRKNA